MKLATCDVDGVATPALVVRADGREVVADIGATLRLAGFPGEAPQSVLDILGRWPELSDPLRTAEALIASGGQPAADLAAARLLPPVGPGQLIVCCGFNYAAHEAEVGGSSVGATWFIKNANATTGSGAPIVIPPDNANVIDYEGELAVVIGKLTRHFKPDDEWRQVVRGFTLANDISARDLQKKDAQWTRAKGFDTFCPVGPIVSDEIDFDSGVTIETKVNGELRQQASTRDFIFSLPQLLAYITAAFTLEPGDLILTGTPSGVGPLTSGDLVEVSVAGLGVLRNPVESSAE
jgi:2-keto-4-pentenoate hydratase/2-oxohepta-3-ene-1,7-dioic acid hydratase in catechol pathway